MEFIHSNKQYIERTMYPINPFMNAPPVSKWLSPIQISAIGDGVVDTRGTLIYAYNFTNTGQSYTVNGVLFQGIDSSNQFLGVPWNQYATSSIYTDGNISSNFENVMDSFVYAIRVVDGIAITDVSIIGLIPGQKYFLQLLIADERYGEVWSRLQNYELLGSKISGIANKPGYSVACEFTAKNSTEILTISSSSSDAVIMNALQLRKI